MAKNKELIMRGEEAAATFLTKRGYEILERNWTCPAGEADIIAMDGDTLVFVEVRTRRGCVTCFPSEEIAADKRAKCEQVALAYLNQSDAIDVSIRFDTVTLLIIGSDRAFIRHHINALSVAAA